jgi:hypothetical protein
MYSIAIVYVGLFVQVAIYARFLNQEWVYRWYSPDRIWVTVAGGVLHVGLAIGQLWYAGFFAWQVPFHYTALFITACIPILIWQKSRAAKRQREADAIDRRL